MRDCWCPDDPAPASLLYSGAEFAPAEHYTTGIEPSSVCWPKSHVRGSGERQICAVVDGSRGDGRRSLDSDVADTSRFAKTWADSWRGLASLAIWADRLSSRQTRGAIDLTIALSRPPISFQMTAGPTSRIRGFWVHAKRR